MDSTKKILSILILALVFISSCNDSSNSMEHPFWGEVEKDTIHQWKYIRELQWNDKYKVRIAFKIDDLEDKVVQENYELIVESWSNIRPKITNHLDEMTSKKDYIGPKFNLSRDYFEFLIPKEPINQTTHITIVLRSGKSSLFFSVKDWYEIKNE